MSSQSLYKEMIGGCCVCSDESGSDENPLVYCDGSGCSVAVHKACYGIIEVPNGPWFCKKCESQERIAKVKCELCPQRVGALKRTDSNGWCHVVCALYIPEVWFANLQTMEPVVLNGVPHDRYNRHCYICEEQNRVTKATEGACMQCNRTGCKQYFHVTCAQSQGLLCEVTSTSQNIKYCGYCSHHNRRLKNNSNIKTIPAFKSVQTETPTPEPSPEKNPTRNLIHDLKAKSIAASIAAVKSPPVDHSVSSTSDVTTPHLTPSLTPHTDLPPALTRSADIEVSNPRVISRSYSEVSDISSVFSPNEEGDNKTVEQQEPSSSMSTHEAPVLQPATEVPSSHKPDPVGHTPMDIEVKARGPPDLTSSTGHKKHKESSKKSNSSSSKKSTKNSTISSTVKGDAKDSSKRKSGGSKRRRDSRDSPSSKPDDTLGAAALSSSFPGLQDLGGTVFGGSPFFQSPPGLVSLPSFSAQDFLSTTTKDPQMVLPPQSFPSQRNASQKQTQESSNGFPLTMEHFLEQQWDHGAQFLMEQGQDFDIASFLNTLHRINRENQNLEDQVKELKARRDHLKAVTARLALPLSMGGPSHTHSNTQQSNSQNNNTHSSSVGSLEDISSPDDSQQAPGLDPSTAPTVHIPHNQSLIVEDILSPAEFQRPLKKMKRIQ